MFSRHRNLVILIFVLFAQIFLLAYQFRRGQDVPLIRNGAIYVVTPLQRGLRSVTDTFRRVIYGYLDLREARRQSQDLSRELGQLRIEAQRLRRDASQAKRLQALLDFRQELPWLTVAAQVIGSGGNQASQSVILDKGSNAGLQPDLPVIVPGGVIGKVLRVFPDTAQVILITDADSGVAALLDNSRIHGVLRGVNQPLSKLSYVINGEPVTVGEILVTSGEDRIYPKGLPLGVVVAVRPGSEFQEIEVQPLAQLNRLEEVLVIVERETNEQWKPTTPEPAQNTVADPKAPAASSPEQEPPEKPAAPAAAATDVADRSPAPAADSRTLR